jgi:hypothetical protein
MASISGWRPPWSEGRKIFCSAPASTSAAIDDRCRPKAVVRRCGPLGRVWPKEDRRVSREEREKLPFGLPTTDACPPIIRTRRLQPHTTGWHFPPPRHEDGEAAHTQR